MMDVAIIVAVALVGLSVLLNLWRLVRGPGVLDRVLAVDTLVINTIAFIMIAGIVYATHAVFEAALLFAMVGFVSTVAFCKFLLRGNVLE